MRRVLVIGIGAGDPGHVTAEAAAALATVDVVFVLEKTDDQADLQTVRQEVLDRYPPRPGWRTAVRVDPARDLSGPSYRTDVDRWHQQRLDLYQELVADELADGQTGAFLVWGDPAIYDSTLRVLDRLAERETVAFERSVIPGISAPQVLAARFGIALHTVGHPILITTGRDLRRRFADGWPPGVAEVTVMLDGRTAFTEVDAAGVDIYWGAYLGTPDELLIAGPLAEVADRIVTERAEARERKGWMFDTYLLRRTADPDAAEAGS